tara:strand:+ start:1658 stop:2452 length:795 start_codon:yes stop_codon:yes gene_type:complete
MLRKNLVVKRAAGRPKKNKISFIASTNSVDRYGDVINQEGWNIAAYERNPVVLLNHNANSLPIGKGSVSVKDGQLMIDVEFDKDDELAQRVERKARNGFLNAVSVGFNPMESIERSRLPKDHPAYTERGGNYFNKSELLEVSIVTIPANSEATAVSAKNLTQIDRLTVRDLIAQELRHILEVEQMEDGRYRIIFAGEMEEMEEEMEEEVVEESYKEEDSEEEEKDKEAAELAMKEEEEEEDEEKEDKGFLTNDERELLALILKS